MDRNDMAIQLYNEIPYLPPRLCGDLAKEIESSNDPIKREAEVRNLLIEILEAGINTDLKSAGLYDLQEVDFSLMNEHNIYDSLHDVLGGEILVGVDMLGVKGADNPYDYLRIPKWQDFAKMLSTMAKSKEDGDIDYERAKQIVETSQKIKSEYKGPEDTKAGLLAYVPEYAKYIAEQKTTGNLADMSIDEKRAVAQDINEFARACKEGGIDVMNVPGARQIYEEFSKALASQREREPFNVENARNVLNSVRDINEKSNSHLDNLAMTPGVQQQAAQFKENARSAGQQL